MTSQKKTIPETSVDAKLLYSQLSDTAVGDFISYAELSKIIGRSIQQNRGPLTTAIKGVQRDLGYVFGTIRGEGIKRLDDQGIVAQAGYVLPKARRAALRAKKQLECVTLGNLKEKDKTIFLTTVSAVAVLHFMTKNKQIKRLEHKVEAAEKQISIGHTLDLFKGNNE